MARRACAERILSVARALALENGLRGREALWLYTALMALRIYNTLSREKELFEPLEPGKVRMYVCGITSYAPCHIGHARAFVAFDVVYRWLKTRYEVNFVRNYTDVDDKIITAARERGEDPAELAARYIARCDSELRALGCAPPTHEPRVTENIGEIIALVGELIDKGFGYAVDGDVYFDVMRFPAYGRLSGRTLVDLSDLEAGARVDVDTRKHSPFDFALWKSAKPDEPAWDSPWGPGRPGWHIECSAMSRRYLGEMFDIHGGGKDLVFPHHENELAQSCAASGAPLLARYWLHNGFVNLMPESCPRCEAEFSSAEASVCGACGYALVEADLKMSKSRGNFYPVGEVMEAFEPEALRILLLGSHYRTPIAFSHKLLADQERRLDRLYETIAALDAFVGEHTFMPGKAFADVFGFDPRARFREAMDDDFNTARAVAELSELFRVANDLLHGNEQERVGHTLSRPDKSRLLNEAQEIIREGGEILGLWQQTPSAYLSRRRMARLRRLALLPEEIERRIEERAEARKCRDFARADAVRQALAENGIVLKDSPQGTTWEVSEET